MYQELIHTENAEKLPLPQDAWILYQLENHDIISGYQACPMALRLCSSKSRRTISFTPGNLQGNRHRDHHSSGRKNQAESPASCPGFFRGSALSPYCHQSKAQEFIGMDQPAEQAEKDSILEQVIPEWDRKAAEREAKYPVKTLFE